MLITEERVERKQEHIQFNFIFLRSDMSHSTMKVLIKVVEQRIPVSSLHTG